MDRRRRPEHDASDSPLKPFSTPSNFLRDVSNLKTPRPCRKDPNPNLASPSSLYFTASKKTPYSSSSISKSSASQPAFRRRTTTVAASASHSKAARRLKALELEQSRSARKVQIIREKTLGSFARSLSAWLNFLLQNPKACGCKVGPWSANDQPVRSSSKGKRESLDAGEAIDVCGKWRSPKRQRRPKDAGFDMHFSLEKPAMQLLENSLREICSLEDVMERMSAHMSRKSCNEVLFVMTQVCKNVDEGRLKMKSHCPLVTDLAVREKATKVLMCYNPFWLRIGLHILFGGDSLLLNQGDQDECFLREFIEKYFLTHVGIARTHAFNKLVGGLYRPGYYEALGNVILKRFLLMAIALDKAKCESSLPIKYGIDNIDGGSPLLFTRHFHVKSTRQVIQEFLMDAMHGEGDLLAHLVILGYKVNYQQSSLVECEFKVQNIFEDLQDGILLCRVVQLLLCDDSILSKVVSPSDTFKRNLQNCSTALQYLKNSGVMMVDSDGVTITATDLANGDKELTCSIMWNMFLHLQVPLIINRTSLLKEIAKIRGSDVEPLMYNAVGVMDLLLKWIQEVCYTQNVEIDSFSSLVDGRAWTCLIKFYFGNDIHQSCIEKGNEIEYNEEQIRRHSPTLLDIAYIQIVFAKLGNSPEVLHLCDILDQNVCIDERSTTILLVFLASVLTSNNKLDILDSCRFLQPNSHSAVLRRLSTSRLLHLESVLPRYPRLCGNNAQEVFSPQKKEAVGLSRSEDVIEKIKFIQLRWHAFTKRRKYLQLRRAALILQAYARLSLARKHILERSARVIQTQFRGLVKRKKFLKIKMSTIFLQAVVRAWFSASYDTDYSSLDWPALHSTHGIYDRYLKFMTERQRFLRTRKAAVVIQRFVRVWIKGKQHASKSMNTQKQYHIFQGRGTLELHWAAAKIQKAWKGYLCNLHFKRSYSATKIQSQWRCWSIRKKYLCQVDAIKVIQSTFRRVIYHKAFQQKRFAAIEIQRFIRGRLARTRLLGAANRQSRMIHQKSYYAFNDSLVNTFELRMVISSIIKLQRWWKQVLFHRSRRHAAICIQSFVRGLIARKAAVKRKLSISVIQRVWRSALLGKMKKCSVLVIQTSIRSWIARQTATQKKCYVVKIQRWWRKILHLKTRKRSVLVIQAYFRGWIARRKAAQIKHHSVIIQSCWRGYLVRKSSRPQLLNLLHRIKLSAANVNDEMRLINRLVAALSELLGYKSITNIRQTCATLDVATELSEKCCETLVAAGAINILLQQIQLLNRGVPDQVVLKHVLSTLRNIVRYKHLAQVLINTPRSMEIIFQEFLRNKNEGFLISCQLLRRLCSVQEGLETARKLQSHVKRLNNLIVELQRKAKFLGRNTRLRNRKDLTLKKLGEAIGLMSLIAEDR